MSKAHGSAAKPERPSLAAITAFVAKAHNYATDDGGINVNVDCGLYRRRFLETASDWITTYSSEDFSTPRALRLGVDRTPHYTLQWLQPIMHWRVCYMPPGADVPVWHVKNLDFSLVLLTGLLHAFSYEPAGSRPYLELPELKAILR